MSRTPKPQIRAAGSANSESKTTLLPLEHIVEMSQPSPLMKLIGFSLALLPIALGAQSDSGPTAYVSISDSPAYATARPCAAGCLWDNTDIYVCSVNAGWYDVAMELQCGCDSLNACYCGQDNAASASSYISSCVSSACSNFPQETNSAINLYNNYCATANVAVSTTSDTSLPSRTASPVAASVASPTTSPHRTTQTSSSGEEAADSTNAAATAVKSEAAAAPNDSDVADEKDGLSRSDLIAIGVGLGVGIPSLIIAIATFCLMRKKGNRRSAPLLQNSYREIYR